MVAFAETPSASQIERSEENLQKEELLREKLSQEEKIFIKKIAVKGASLITEDRIKEIILPYQGKWLIKKDIQQIMEFIQQEYKNKGNIGMLNKISYRIHNKNLIIEVTELKKGASQ